MLEKLLQLLKYLRDVLLGPVSTADPPTLEAALTDLLRDREETRRELEQLKIRRHAALLDDESSDEQIISFDRQIARAEVALEECTRLEPQLRTQIRAALQERRRQAAELAENSLRERMSRCREKLYRDAKDCAAIVSAFEGMQGLGDAAAGSASIRDGVAFFGFVAKFVTERAPSLDGALATLTSRAKPVPAVAASTAPTKAAAPRPSESLRPTAPAEVPAVPRAPPEANATGVVPEGYKRVVTLRPGFPHPTTGKACQAGCVLDLPSEQALAAIRGGLVEAVG